ncbi:cysteine peptidase family C39 domain-containing protein [Leptothermofonsia sp. ETS-13]|uniref:cysteine peptidase family C39 domain-containing protein n=1 Tax=Leptothermofonsia sp. ETS-13 TaxID=3035696 RepID=UPI003B9E3035
MKRIADVGKNGFPALSTNAYELLAEILLARFPTDNQWVIAFSQAFEIQEIQLGDEPSTSSDTNSLENSIQACQGCRDVYIVCQGSIRLICSDATHQQAVPVGLLEVGDMWGADEQFCDRPFPYRAIAAGSALIAVMASNQLPQWLQSHPQLHDYLHNVTLTRQQLIFLKVATELRSQSSHTLKRLLPYLNLVHLPAGTNLTQATPATAGRFWLYSGQIHSQSSSPPEVGNSWGYPDPVPPDWVAATDLQVYQLPGDHWEMIQVLVPALNTQLSQASHVSPERRFANPQVISQPANHPVAFTKPQQVLPPHSQSSPIRFARPKPQKWHQPWFWKGYPFIQQQSSSDCGAACLAMIAQYWGKRLSLNMLRNLAGVGRSGASLKNLARAAESIGFLSRPVRSSFSRLAEQTTPWIAYWQGDHYVVVYRVKRNRVILADPAVGRQSLSIPDFQTSWTGYALLLTPTELLQAMPSSKLSLGRFWGHSRRIAPCWCLLCWHPFYCKFLDWSHLYLLRSF